jgi:AraC family transcriptional regulator of adaptative response / DNA-3-methyladenine glycosylase II
MPISDVAFAAGFSSIRQFNDTVRAVCDMSPTMLRRRARARDGGDALVGAGAMSVRLPVRTPFAYEGLFGHLAATAVPGIEEVRDGTYRRTLRLPRGTGVVGLTPHPDHVQCRLVVDEFRDVSAAIARCRRLLDLDADPEAVVEALGADDHLAPLVTKAPGQRIPRTVDEHELAVRVVLGQQVSTAAARTHAARLVSAYGDCVSDSAGGLTHLFPSVAQLSDIDTRHLAFPASRQRTLTTLIAALSNAEVVLDSGCDWQVARQQLLALPGIGPWTAEMIAMRGLGDPDAFPVTDLGVAAAARHVGLPSAPKPLSEHARTWRPWRSYATQHLWTALDHAVNQWPPKEK